jgi:hypothetical protein
MPKFKVTVLRTGYAATEIEVEAANEEEAEEIAQDEAGGYSFSEHSSEYAVDHVEKIPEPEPVLPEELREKAEAGGLDEVIHEAMAERAANINNRGSHGQIEFLVEEFGAEIAHDIVKQALGGTES